MFCAESVCFVCSLLCTIRTRDRGAARAQPSQRPLSREERGFQQGFGRIAPWEGEVVSIRVIPGWSAGSDLGCAIAHPGISRFRCAIAHR